MKSTPRNPFLQSKLDYDLSFAPNQVDQPKIAENKGGVQDVWPLSSPDLNPLDFFVWGAAERDTNRSPHNTKQSLITSIMEVFANFSREDVVTACSRVRSRLEEVVAANGDFIR